MPVAATLRLGAGSAAAVTAMWEALADAGLDGSCRALGYAPHVTLAVWPDEVPEAPLRAALAALAMRWTARPVTLAGFGLFPGDPPVLWLAPVPDATLLARQAELLSALPGLACHPHHHPGAWVPHVTLGTPRDAAAALAALLPGWRGPLAGVLDALELVRFPPVEVLWRSALLSAAPRPPPRAPRHLPPPA